MDRLAWIAQKRRAAVALMRQPARLNPEARKAARPRRTACRPTPETVGAPLGGALPEGRHEACPYVANELCKVYGNGSPPPGSALIMRNAG